MNKRYFLFCLLCIFLVCSDDPSRLKRKKHIRPHPADYEKYHVSKQKLKEGSFSELQMYWHENGNIFMESFSNSNSSVTLAFYENGMIEKYRKSKQVIAPMDEYRRYDKEASSYVGVSFGGELQYYESGKIKISSCNVAMDYRTDPVKCGEEIHYKEDGSIEKKINHPQKCTQGCDLMIPYRDPGKYIAMKDDIKVWDSSIYAPDEHGKMVLKRYAREDGTPKKILKKGDVITVSEDMQIFENGNTAPWVKVKLGLFSYGYVSSDHLDGPFE